jgi:hypothetical protein
VDNRPAVPAAGGPEGEKPVTTDLYFDPEVALSIFRKTIHVLENDHQRAR